MDAQNEALVGPNPRDEIIQEIKKIREKQLVNHKSELAQREKDTFLWATKELARRYFGLPSLDYFYSEKLASLQDLIYEKAKKAYICQTIILALIPIIGWGLLGMRWIDRDCCYCWPTHKFVKLYKKFRKKEKSKKAEE